MDTFNINQGGYHLREKFGIFVTISILILVVFTSGCFINKNHFENNEISFDYPTGWKAGAVMDLPGVIVGVRNNNADVKISKRKIPTGSSIKYLYNQSMINHAKNLAKYCYQPISEKTIKVDGVTAYENIYKIGCNQSHTRQMQRNVWLEKNGYIYVLSCNVAPPEDFDKENRNFDMIINSFHVK